MTIFRSSSGRSSCSSRWWSDGLAVWSGGGVWRARLAELANPALEIERSPRQVPVFCFHQEGVEAAAVVHRSQRIRRDTQLDGAAQRVRHQGDIEQIGQKSPLRLDVRVAHPMTDLGSPAGQLAPSGHKRTSTFAPTAAIAGAGKIRRSYS